MSGHKRSAAAMGDANTTGSSTAKAHDASATAAPATPRAYQLELFEAAKLRNTVAMLPTGSGKTLIAALLVGHYANAVVAGGQAVPAGVPAAGGAAAGGATRRRVLFLCPTKLLVRQQAAVLRASTPLRVCDLTGDDGVDFWSAATWAERLADAELLVATPALVQGALARSFLQMRDVVLLVLDECHHAVKSHPMNEVMKHWYAPLPPEQRPRVLGLTASPVHGMAASTAAVIAQLEATLFSKVVTALDWHDVTAHAPRAEMSVEYFSAAADAQQQQSDANCCGSSAARRARRVLAASLAELGLWGAAAALRHELARAAAPPAVLGDGDELTMLLVDAAAAAELAAPPQAQFGGARARRGAGHAADAEALADEFAVALASVGAPAVTTAAPKPSIQLDQYDPLFRRTAAAIEATLRAAPPATLAALAHAALGADASRSAAAVAWVSDKVAALLRVLLRHARAPPGWRAVVFCERKAVAHALAALLAHLSQGEPPSHAAANPFAFLRAGAQSGYAAGDGGSAAAQAAALTAFRNGRLNVICATSVLEEGVDVPECALVVLFDLARNVKSFIQSRGRARAQRSALVVLAPRGGGHATLLAEVAAAEEAMRARATQRAAALAAGGGDAAEDSGEEAEAEALRAAAPALRANGPSEYVVPATGAKVTLAGAVALIHAYTAKLPHDQYCDAWAPRFVVSGCSDTGAGQYTCSLTVPGHVWLGVRSSGPQPSKRAAKAAAALAAAAALHQGGALTDHLAPAAAREAARADALNLNDDADAAAAGSKDADASGVLPSCELKTPDVLEPCVNAASLADPASAGTLLGRWHAAALLPHGPQPDAAAHPVPCARLALLTRAPLPPLPPLRLVVKARPACARLVPIADVDIADAAREEALRRFLAWAHGEMWALNPGVGTFAPLAAPLAADGASLDWAMLLAADAPWAAAALATKTADDVRAEAAVGCVVWTQHGGTARSYYALRLRPDVTLDTPVSGDAGAPTLADHFWSRFGVPRAALQDSAWLEAVLAPATPRCLLPAALSPAAAAAAAVAAASGVVAAPGSLLLPAALLQLPGRCPAPLWRALAALPAQLWRLRSLLLARELAERILPGACDAALSAFPGNDADGDPRRFALLLAVHEATTSGAAAEDENYQRLEILGDAWLKFAASAWLFAARPDAHEGQLSALRSARTSNATLAARARAAGLQRYLRTARFAPGASPPPPPPLRRKALADALEALLGAAVHAHGADAASAVAVALQVLPASAPPLSDYAAVSARLAAAAAAAPGAPPPRACDDASLAALSRLEAALGYIFRGGVPCQGRVGRLALLDEALTHASACGASPAPAYQRLEFLGDAALDFLTMRELFSGDDADSHDVAGTATSASPGVRRARLPTAGALSALRAAAVNNERLASRAAALRLGAHLRHGSPALHAELLAYATSAAAAVTPARARGCFGGGARGAPKVLADVAEACVGAVLLDCGADLAATWRVARPLLALEDARAAVAAGGGSHPVAALFERCAAAAVTCQLLDVVEDVAPANDVQPEALPANAAVPGLPTRPRAPPASRRVRALVGGAQTADVTARSRRAARRLAAETTLAQWSAALA